MNVVLNSMTTFEINIIKYCQYEECNNRKRTSNT